MLEQAQTVRGCMVARMRAHACVRVRTTCMRVPHAHARTCALPTAWTRERGICPVRLRARPYNGLPNRTGEPWMGWMRMFAAGRR
eukprot:75653-Alexandrium_andersonii.AAC.1